MTPHPARAEITVERIPRGHQITVWIDEQQRAQLVLDSRAGADVVDLLTREAKTVLCQRITEAR